MEIALLVKHRIYIETGPWLFASQGQLSADIALTTYVINA